MSIEILMPALSPTMTEGTLQKWLIKIGDEVKPGDVIAEIETDKATMEIEAVDKGILTEILVQEGTKGVSVNTLLAILNGSKNNKEKKIISNKKITDNKKLIKDKTKSNKKNISNNIIQNKDDINQIIASPYAKKFSENNNIDLKSITGSGPKGRIIKRDLISINNQSKITQDSEEPSLIRKIIAEKTTKTKSTVPHFYLTIESKVDKLLVLRKKINEQNQNNKVSINDILVKALAIAQSKNPKTNVSWINNKIVKYSSVDVSIAVAINEGLMTPVIKNADTKGLLEISKEIRNYVIKAKQGKLTPDEYNGGTISISNLGMFGINEFSAIINQPQSSILAIGSIQKIPLYENDELRAVNILKSTLSADHRVLDGAIAAKLLKDFSDIIEDPFQIWLSSNDLEII